MALDRFVYFEKRVPTRREILTILENFLGGCGTVTEPRPSRWLLDLPGQNTSPFKGLQGRAALVADVYSDPADAVRYIEVIFQRTEGLPPSIDVLTRHADNFTNAIAARLASDFAAFFGGRLDDG